MLYNALWLFCNQTIDEGSAWGLFLHRSTLPSGGTLQKYISYYFLVLYSLLLDQVGMDINDFLLWFEMME